MHSVPFHRRILPWIFGIAFVAMAPAVIFYTSGYRYDAKRGKVERNGTIIFDSTPSGAELLIDGRSSGRTTPVTLQDIVPGSHVFRLQKTGYTDWQKTLDIYPERVTFADHIRLWPQTSPNLLRPASAEMTSPSPDGSRLLLLSSTSTAQQIRFSSLPSFRISSTSYFPATAPGSLIHWATDNRYALIEYPAGDAALFDTTASSSFPLPKGHYRWEGRQVVGTDELSLLTMQRDGTLSRNPLERNTVDRIDALELRHTTSTASLILVDTEQPKKGFILPRGDWHFWSHENTVILLRDGSRWLALIPTSDGNSYQASEAYGNKLLVQETSSGKQAVLLAEHELWLWDFSRSPDLLYRQSEPLVDAAWHPDGLHVFFSTKNSVQAMELDPRDGRRRDTLASFDAVQGIGFYSPYIFILGERDGLQGLWNLKIQ